MKLLLLTLMGWSSVFAQSDYDRMTARCQELISKNSQSAEDVCRLAVEAQPQRWEGHVLFGSALALAKKNDEASREFNKAKELSPADKRAGIEALVAKALSTPTSGISPTPTSSVGVNDHYEAQKYGTVGVQYMKDSKYVLAADQFRAAIRLEPNNAEWHRKLAQALEKLDLRTEAIAELQAADVVHKDLRPGAMKINAKDGLTYLWIPPGIFNMGCSPGDSNCGKDERPNHQVTITKGFWMGQTSVTVGAWKRYRAATGRSALSTSDALKSVTEIFTSGAPKSVIEALLRVGQNVIEASANESMPAVFVSWEEARDFCGWGGNRLPKEAEWEYAARAGTTDARYGNLDSIAWYLNNSGDQRMDSGSINPSDYTKRLSDNRNVPHPVGQKEPNAWGLYDTLGNVGQWTADWYGLYKNDNVEDPVGPAEGASRVVRGSPFTFGPTVVRVSRRLSSAGSRSYLFGVRCAGE